MSGPEKHALKVGIAGLGAVGWPVARKLDGGIEGLELVAVAVRRPGRAREKLSALNRPPALVMPGDLAALADVIVECVPAAVFDQVARPAVEAGRIFIPISVGAMLERADLVERARATGARILVPTGALVGLDAVRAAAESEIAEARIITRKPPKSLAGAPYLEQQGISLENLAEPLRLFAGPAAEGVKGFPANVNVAAALSLAGIGPERTQLEIWADPDLQYNTHRIEVVSDSARLSLKIENVPSEETPGTGKITALSIIAQLRRLVEPMTVGT